MSPLLPQARFVESAHEPLTLTSPILVSAPLQFVAEVEVFAADLRRAIGWDVAFSPEADGADVVIEHCETMAPEGFSLRVDGRVEIAAATSTGLFYALTALRQLGPPSLFSTSGARLEEWVVESVDVVDEPVYAWRGSHLDVSRHFFDVETVCRHIDLIAEHRLNYLHLHLNDDQGWRVDVPAWPLLTTIGAFRTGSPVGHENDNVQDSVPHGGYYTAEDMARIRNYATLRHVTIVPEIDLPGHAQAVLAAYPELGNTGERFDVWNHWGISEHVLNVSDEALSFAEDVVLSVASHFPGSPVHIGGDECPSTEWSQSPAAQAVMRQHGFREAHELQGLFTTRLAAALQRAGHEVLAWDEVLDAEVPEGTTIVAWRSEAKGVEAARRGYATIMAPETVFYFDVLNTDDPREPVAISPLPRVTTWRDVYGHAIVPSDMTEGEAALVRGAQVQLWTEYIATRDHLDYMAFPRLCAFAEVVWGSAADVDEFEVRLRRHLERLAARGVNFHPLD